MAELGTSWRRGDGVVTFRSAPSGIGTNVKYKYLVHWVLGGEGESEGDGAPVKPQRVFPDDTFIQASANVGDPCTVTVSPQGNVFLFVQTEVFGVDDCTG